VTRRGTSRARTRRTAAKASPFSNVAPGVTRIGSEPAYEYGSPFATRTNAARPTPAISSVGSQRPRRSRSIFATMRRNATSPGRAPPGARPSSLSRRTASPSKPSPAEKLKRRPLTEPSEMRRKRSDAIASAMLRAASTASRGSPSARGSTLVPPPGRNPIGSAPSAPFRASLYVPSPEKTRIASTASEAAAAASSVAWPGPRVNRVSTSTRSRNADSTSPIRRPVTWVEYGLTIRSAFFTLPSMPRRTALIVAVPEAEPSVRDLRLAHDSSAALGVPAHVTILFPFAHPDGLDEAALEQLFEHFAPFDFTLDRIERFDDGL